MNGASWSSFVAAGATGDREPEEETPGLWPEKGYTCEVIVAVGYDGRSVVVSAPEEFRSVVGDSEGSAYFRDGGLSREMEKVPGLYRVQLAYYFEPPDGEDCVPDYGFQQTGDAEAIHFNQGNS